MSHDKYYFQPTTINASGNLSANHAVLMDYFFSIRLKVGNF